MRTAATLMVSVLVGGCGGDPPRTERSSAVLPVSRAIELPAEPGAVLVHGPGVWVTQPRGILRVSIARKRITRQLRLGMTPHDIAAGHGSLWVTAQIERRERLTKDGRVPVIRVVRVEPRTGQVLARIPIPARSNGNRLAVTGRSVWVTDPAEGTASRIFAIDPMTQRLTPLPGGEEPLALLPHHGRVWSANHDDGTLRAHDPLRGRTMASIALPGEPHGLAGGSGSVWVADGHHHRVLQVAPDSLEIVRRVDLGHETGPLAPAGRGGVWATAPWRPPNPRRLRRIDQHGRLAETVVTDDPVVDFESRARTLWIATTGRNRLLQVRE